MCKLMYFSLSEFDSPDDEGSGANMQTTFLKMLDDARLRVGMPFVITSGYRTKAHNEKVGGVDDSAHTKGYAADIHVKNSRWRYLVINSLLKAGFTRIGVAEKFVHVDNDPDMPENVIWKY